MERGGHIIFMCAANVIRSPMAAAIFAYKMQARSFNCRVESAGVMDLGYSTGAAPQWKQVSMAEQFDLSSHRSRHISRVPYEATTFFVCADRDVAHKVRDLKGVDQDRVLILNGVHGVEDPVHNPTVQGFKDCFTQIYTGVDKLIEILIE